jgi:DNA repair protein RAD7
LTDFLASHNIDANQIRQTAEARRDAVARAAAAAQQVDQSSPDDSPEPVPAEPIPTRKLNKAQLAKQKQREKAIAKIKASATFARRAREEGIDDDSAADAQFLIETQGGQHANCALCDVRFLVTPYTITGPDGGMLCTPCAKDWKKADGPRKKRKLQGVDRRRVASRKLEGQSARGVKTLVDCCCATLANNVHNADDLGHMGPVLMDKLAAILSKKRLFRPNVLNLFLQPGTETITIYDGAYMTSDDYIKIFQLCPTIKHLRIRNAVQFKNHVMDYLTNSTVELQSFSIHGANLIDDEHWEAFLDIKGKHLKSLKVYYNDGSFGDGIVKKVADWCPDLERLKISHNWNVSDQGLKHIPKLKKLQHLTLHLLKETTNAPYVDIIKIIGHQLRTLSISEARELDDSVLEAIHTHCTKLEKLRIHDNHEMTDAGFAKLFTDWGNPSLRFVDFGYCRHIDPIEPEGNTPGIGLCNEGCTALMAHSAKNLRFLRINDCRHITSECFENVFAYGPAGPPQQIVKGKSAAKSQPSLVATGPSSFANLRNPALGAAAPLFPHLEAADVSFCWGVTDEAVTAMWRSCPELKVLKVFGNHKIRDLDVPAGRVLLGWMKEMGGG